MWILPAWSQGPWTSIPNIIFGVWEIPIEYPYMAMCSTLLMVIGLHWLTYLHLSGVNYSVEYPLHHLHHYCALTFSFESWQILWSPLTLYEYIFYKNHNYFQAGLFSAPLQALLTNSVFDYSIQISKLWPNLKLWIKFKSSHLISKF